MAWLLGLTNSVLIFYENVLKEGVATAAPYAALAEAKKAGAVTINYGLFINRVISFVIVAFAVFIWIKNLNRLKQEEAPAAPDTKECPFCASKIALKATRCPHCTSELTSALAIRACL